MGTFRPLTAKKQKDEDIFYLNEIKKGNEHYFALLVKKYEKKIKLLGFSFFKNFADVDDFSQEVFLKVYISLASFRGDSLFSTWLLRVAYNTAINSTKRTKQFFSMSDQLELVDPNFTPEENHLRSVSAKTIADSIKDLPSQYAHCVELYFFCDVPYNEISKITDQPVNTIKSHIFRAKKILRSKLIDEFGEGY
ncbi:MAG: RNA polymerase sigma factor [Treponemataceae bacterium]